MASDGALPRVVVGVDSWAGRRWYAAHLLRRTATRAQVRWREEAHVGRRRVTPGDVTWVPLGSVRQEGADDGE